MQWIFMLVGLVVGGLAGESVSGSLLGGLIGLGLGQALRLQSLEGENAKLRKELKGFAERFERGTTRIHERLVVLEGSTQGARAESEPSAADDPLPTMAEPAPDLDSVTQEPAPVVAEQVEPDAELQWELPQIQLAPAPAPAPAPVTEIVEAEPEPVMPPTPREPNLIERAFDAGQAWLFGGNTVLRVGAVLLFLGLAFLLRYATEGVVVPIQLRYAGVAASAIALLGLGWWLRNRSRNYALILQGTGIAVLYLTVFAAMRLHPLLDPKMALGLLVLVTVFSAMLAVLQDALGLAVAAALGGFAAPILTSTGSGNHVALFSYFILLNSGIFVIAWFKAWRLLNLVGFVGTFGIGLAWGVRSYKPELLWSTEPFLILFFLMYVAIGLLFTRRKLKDAADAPEERSALLKWSAGKADYVDGTVLFGPPVVGFGLQFGVVQHIEFAAAFSALALGLLYMTLARVIHGRAPGRLLMLVETCLALGVVFGTLAIPLGLDARWTSAAWAVEGAGIYWLALRQERRLAQAFALLLQAGAAVAYLGQLGVGEQTVLSGAPLGAVMLGAALLFSFYQLRQASAVNRSEDQRFLLSILACTGLAFLFLVAPLCFAAEGTAISWALAGLATLFVGLRLQSRTFLFCAFAVQLLGGALFLAQLRAGGDGGVLDSGWHGLLTCSLIGLAMVVGMIMAVRDEHVSQDRQLMRGLSLVLLVGLVFINLAVLFVLPWASASAVWAGSGLLVIWLSLHLQLRASFFFGLVLQVIGAVAFLMASPLLLGALPSEGLRPLAHSGFWTPLVLALAAQVGAWRLRHVALHGVAGRLGDLSLERLSQVLLVWGAGWWALSWAGEVARFAAPTLQATLLLSAAAVSVALWTLIAARLRWTTLALLCTALIPLAGVILLSVFEPLYHPAARFGWLAWALVFAVHLLALRKLAELLPKGPASAAHVLGCWLILAVLALELRYGLMQLSEQYNAWRWLGWSVLPSAYLLAMAVMRRSPWPVAAYPREYRVYAAAPLAVLMLGWFWLANIFSDGLAEPLPFLPLVNPLELGLLFALVGVHAWAQTGLVDLGVERGVAERLLTIVTGASLFALLTATVMRTAHHWAGVPFDEYALQASMVVQAGLSLVWTLIALALMVFGHRRVRREWWLVGAVLIAVVVCKLFFVELSNRGGLERIVSFIGVGVLLLVVGYFAPLPPRKEESKVQE
ncbi:DUF2339 domain-containing protein [Pseudomonas sp. LRF_L74]|uniref:DUF2339 domain-containing protein n=1 Tax=Pseudomonas sp. LRF_L74 TaxID=3369422 RepID=UPI003F5FBAAC